MKNSSNIFTNRFLYILIKHLLPIFILSSKLPLQKTFAISLHVISINFRIFRSKHTPSKSLPNFSKSPHKSHKLILVRNPRVSRRRRREFLRISLTKWRRRKWMVRNQWTIVDPFPPGIERPSDTSALINDTAWQVSLAQCKKPLESLVQ